MKKPRKRTVWPFVDHSLSSAGRGKYIACSNFAVNGERYIESLFLLEKDFSQLCEYIDPDEKNFPTFSSRTNEFLMRCSIEVEANFKAIMRENGYASCRLTMKDYSKVDNTHRLSDYECRIVGWRDKEFVFRPFEDWASGRKLSWYEAYNLAKHDRHEQLERANFGEAANAFCALACLLASQFYDESFSPHPSALAATEGLADGFQSVRGGVRIKFPCATSYPETYDFAEHDVVDTADFFERHDYNSILGVPIEKS